MREAPDGAAGAVVLTQDEAVEGQGPSLPTPSAQVVKAHVQFTNRKEPTPTFKSTGHILCFNILSFESFSK